MSDNKKYYYLKLKDNFFDSEEMIILQNMPDGYLYSDILFKMYLRSLKNDGKLMFNELIPYTTDILSQIVRHHVGVVEKAIKTFAQLGLIEIMDNGAIYMLHVQNYIGHSSSEADRQRAYQIRIKEQKALPDKTCKKSNRKTTPEKELELEIEKEIYGVFKRVKLKRDEYDKLNAKFEPLGYRAVDYIDRLDGYIEQIGKDKYKSHYATILNWHRKDLKDNPKKESIYPEL